MFYKIAKASVLFLLRLWFRYDIKGKENIPKDGGFIVVANHQFLIDPAVVTEAVGKKLTIMAKKELFKNKLLSRIFYSVGAFPVDRGKGDMSAIETAEKAIKDGSPLLIFPEGTRSKSGKLLKIKSGAVLVAHETGADILPIVIDYKNGCRIFGKITVLIMPIIKNHELGIGERSIHAMKNATKLLTEKFEEGLGEIRK